MLFITKSFVKKSPFMICITDCDCLLLFLSRRSFCFFNVASFCFSDIKLFLFISLSNSQFCTSGSRISLYFFFTWHQGFSQNFIKRLYYISEKIFFYFPIKAASFHIVFNQAVFQ